MAEASKSPPPQLQTSLKLVLLGNSAVGKTSLAHAFTDGAGAGAGAAMTPFMTTLGADWVVRTVVVDKQRVKVTLWDTGGQERFHSLAPNYLRGSDGVVLAFGLDDRKSFGSVGRWSQAVADATDASKTPIVLVANKADLPAEHQTVGYDEGEALAEQLGAPFYATSARTGQNVDLAIMRLVRLALARGRGKRAERIETQPIAASDEPSAESLAAACSGSACAVS